MLKRLLDFKIVDYIVYGGDKNIEFLFIDESERQKTNRENNIFSLCGLMVSGRSLLNLENELNQLKENLKLNNLKMLRGNYDKSFKIDATNKIKNILQSNKIKIISSVLIGTLNKNKFDKKHEDLYFAALSFIIERFHLHLRNKDRYGIVIFDSVAQNIEKKLRKRFYEYVSKEVQKLYGEVVGHYKTRIYPSIFFTNDEFSTILQVTDLISAALNNACWKSLEEDKKLDVDKLPTKNKYLEIYWPLFKRSPNNKVEGWGIKIWYLK
ncbi:MAG: DUF3800 domain-containing protein [Candidatus Aenigmatarchaeota archaeon]